MTRAAKFVSATSAVFLLLLILSLSTEAQTTQQGGSTPPSNTPAIIAAVATSVAALVGLIGVLLQNNRNIRHQQRTLDSQLTAQRETLKTQLDSQRDALDRQLTEQREMFERQQKATREQFRIEKLHSLSEQLATKIAAASHSMCWLTWRAWESDDEITNEHLKSYDEELHKVLPEVLGLQAGIAALDPKKFESIRPFVTKLMYLDGAIGKAGLQIESNREDAISALKEYHEQAKAMEDRLPEEIRKLLEPVG